MIVTLTHHQWNTMQRRIPELHRTSMQRYREKYGRSSHEYDMPAIAWRQILDRLVETAYGPMGGKLDSAPKSLYSAVKRIASEVMRIENHPALRHAAIEGWIGDVIPVWGVNGTPDHWAVYPPDEVVSFTLLGPIHDMNLGMEITQWRPVPRMPRSSWTFHEATHLLFV